MSDALPYDPLIALHRRHLAQRILKVVLDADFLEEDPTAKNSSIKERVFYRVVTNSPDIRVQVWTSVTGDGDAATVREVGDDAIRVCAVYRSKKDQDRGIVSTTRIHRVGTVDAICDRLLTRMREVYGKAARPNRCTKCNAPTFKSKKGNEVCADLCFVRG